MTIYFDENLPPVFAEGFQKLQDRLLQQSLIYTPVNLKSIPVEFGRGCLDTDFFEILKGTDSCCITTDRHMRTRPHERVLYEKAGLGLFIIEGGKKNLKYWEIVELLVRRWPAILRVFQKVCQWGYVNHERTDTQWKNRHSTSKLSRSRPPTG